MMHYLNMDALYWEMQELMNNNFRYGRYSARFAKAKKQILAKIGEIIQENRKDIIASVKESD